MAIITPEQFKRIFKWKYKEIISYLIVVLLFSAGGWRWKIFSENKTQNNTQKNRTTQENKTNIENNNIVTPEVLGENDTKNNKQGIEKEFNEEDWVIDKKRIEKEVNDKGQYDDFLCVKDSKIFDSAILLYKEKIPLGITFKLRYILKNNVDVTDNIPKLIFSFGDKSNFRIFLPKDSKSEFIGIEKINIDKTKTRKHIRLINRIDSFKENIFEIKIKNFNANKASFLYSLKYFPLIEDNKEIGVKQISDSDNFEEYLPWVDPGNIGFKQNVGIGVFNNVCIKIVSATLSSDE